ncbi:MAG: type I-U CRISPR-associated helicase/endonuclease Cas3 [Pirellulaceae bacterium]
MNSEDFCLFFRERHGYAPYQWQERMCHQVLESGWPDFIQLPTGSGKTSVLDIAVFALAEQAELPPSQRTAATRIFFVIDRRIVVDEADRNARAIANHLADSMRRDDLPGSKRVAEKLLRLAQLDQRKTVTPLEVHTLRGGFFRTNDWAGSLVQPMIVTSTVDQIGSRLLFRGYGISPAARPLQAALVGTDSLLILDEAHTATAMGETVDSIHCFQKRQANRDAPIANPLKMVQMTATLPKQSKEGNQANVFRLDKQDLADSDSLLVKRYRTTKSIKLDIARSAKGKKVLIQLAKDLAGRVQSHVDDGVRSLAIVVNRIATARRLYELLNASKKLDVECHLMIGRMRPIDRDRIANRLREKLGTGQNNDTEKPIVVIATQCLEVGADLDFERMISEAASLDALRQRFGRMNRSGSKPQGHGEIVIRTDQDLNDTQIAKATSMDADPVYGKAIAKTFSWLRSIGDGQSVDFGAAAMDEAWSKLLAEDAELAQSLLIELPEKAVLLPAHLDLLSQTYEFFVPPDGTPQDGTSRNTKLHRIAVHPDPDVGVFLHGMQRRDVDAQICWRADLTNLKEVGKSYELRSINHEAMIKAVSEAPPTSPECMSISLSALKEFLTSSDAKQTTEADQSAMIHEDSTDDAIAASRRPVVWRGPDDSVVCTNTSQIRPGDTLVLPVSAGGWSILGHVPDDVVDPAKRKFDAVSADTMAKLIDVDVADEAYLRSTWKPRIRLFPLHVAVGIGTAEIQERARESTLSPSEIRDTCESLALRFTGLRARVSRWWSESAGESPAPELQERGSNQGVILTGAKRLTVDKIHDLLNEDSNELGIPLTEFNDDTSSLSDRPVLLADHLQRVSQRATTIATALGLDGSLVQSIQQAGLLHDLGKSDPRFQSMLFGGSRNEVWLQRSLLAKSRKVARTYSDRCRDLERSTLPVRFRHELLSLQIADQTGLSNCDLVLHLIASHHGHARPWMPPCRDPDPPSVDLQRLGLDCQFDQRNEAADSKSRTDIAERFWSTQATHGVWATAYLETILRIADQQISREEAEGFHSDSTAEPIALPKPQVSDLKKQHALLLGGINGDNPLGLLATLGIFRVIDASVEHSARLHWEVSDGAWRPVVWTSSPLSESVVHKIVTDFLNSEATGALDAFDEKPDVSAPGAGKITSCPRRFHKVACDFQLEYLSTPSSSRLECDIAAALGSECSQKRSAKERAIEHSELYMTKGSGHQRMLDLIRVIRSQTTVDDVEKALFTDWTYDDVGRGRSLRWDPAEDRPYARRWKNPGSDPVMTVLGANFLAIEAISFFPTAVTQYRLATTAFMRSRRKTYLSWPIWTIPLCAQSVKALLQSSELHAEDPSDLRLMQHGVAVVKRVERIRNDKYFNFSHAESV